MWRRKKVVPKQKIGFWVVIITNWLRFSQKTRRVLWLSILIWKIVLSDRIGFRFLVNGDVDEAKNELLSGVAEHAIRPLHEVLISGQRVARLAVRQANMGDVVQQEEEWHQWEHLQLEGVGEGSAAVGSLGILKRPIENFLTTAKN